MHTKRNITLELLKLFASYMVVFIHISFPGRFGIIIHSLARFAVPFFFLISGFYSYKSSAEKIKCKIKNVLVVIGFSTLSYTLLKTALFFINGDIGGIVSHFAKYLSLDTLVKFFVFNVTVSSGHLWYLFAILYVYLIFYFVTIKQIREDLVFLVSLLLLLLHLLLGECLSAFGIVLSNVYIRNFALMGIPFFGLGLLARKYKKKFQIIPGYVLFIAGILGISESVVSRAFLGNNELYIGSLLILFVTVVIFIKHSNIDYPRFFRSSAGCSKYVYIFHSMVAIIIGEIYKILHINYTASVFLQNLHPLIVCIFSTVLAYLIIRISNLFTRKNV